MELPNELHALTGDRELTDCGCDLVTGRCDCRRKKKRKPIA
jgi:hypothetical protein